MVARSSRETRSMTEVPAALRVVMLGATGAVGNHAARTLASMDVVQHLTVLGRRDAEGLHGPRVTQRQVDVLDPATYREHLSDQDVAVCCLGVGEPSKVSREQFVRVDKDAVLDFAAACRAADVRHFELLSSVGVDSRSRAFYLRTKGELEDGLRALGFERLSLFHPSVIVTPENRYGFSQAVTLAVWPKLTPLLVGGLRKLRGIPVAQLGQAMARNVATAGTGEETLEWDAISKLAAP